MLNVVSNSELRKREKELIDKELAARIYAEITGENSDAKEEPKSSEAETPSDDLIPAEK